VAPAKRTPGIKANERLIHPDPELSIEEVRAGLAKYRVGLQTQAAAVRY